MKHLFWLLLLIILALRYFTSIPHFINGQTLKVSGNIYSEYKFNGLKVSLFREDINYGDYLVLTGEYQDGELKNIKILKHDIPSNFLLTFRQKLLSFYESA